MEGVKEYIDQENEIFGARIGEIFEVSLFVCRAASRTSRRVRLKNR